MILLESNAEASYLIGQGEGEEVEPVGVPLGDDLAEHLEVAHLGSPVRRRVRRLGRRLQASKVVVVRNSLLEVWAQLFF